MSKRIALLSAAAFAALALTATIVAPVSAQDKMKSEMSGEKTVMVGGAAMFPSKNIIQNAVNSKDHTTLVAAVKAAGLVETPEGNGPFPVFAADQPRIGQAAGRPRRHPGEARKQAGPDQNPDLSCGSGPA